MDLKHFQRHLGGEISGGQLLCPGPGHSASDRSLSVKVDANAPDGFLVHSFADDDPIRCKDYVREKCGLDGNGKTNGRRPRATSEEIEAMFRAAVRSQRRDDERRVEGMKMARCSTRTSNTSRRTSGSGDPMAMAAGHGDWVIFGASRIGCRIY